MTRSDVMEFVRQNPICHIATMDGTQPRVRAFAAIVFEDEKIYFTTGAMKSVWAQLQANPRVELCWCTPDYTKMLRISGEMEEVDDRAKKQHLIDGRDYLKGIKADDAWFKLLRIKEGKARFWTMADNTKESALPAVDV